MKHKIIAILLALTSIVAVSSCKNDHTYPDGTEEFENYYYLGFLPWNNTLVTVNRNAGLLKFHVQFQSAFTRDYNADAKYLINNANITNPAVAGQDFNIVDKDGKVLQPVNGFYTMTFPQAKAKIDTIYVQLLNSSVTGTRQTEINIVPNVTSTYTVGNFSEAFRRPIQIR